MASEAAGPPGTPPPSPTQRAGVQDILPGGSPTSPLAKGLSDAERGGPACSLGLPPYPPAPVGTAQWNSLGTWPKKVDVAGTICWAGDSVSFAGLRVRMLMT